MKPEAVILDMDGTLANVSGIRHFVVPTPERRFKDFDSFHAASVDCPTNPEVVRLAHAARDAGHVVLIVTARRATWRHHTAWFLAMHGIPSDAMFMRAVNDHRSDVDVKRDILASIRTRWTPVLAVDDNPSVAKMWREEGIPVIMIPGWED